MATKKKTSNNKGANKKAAKTAVKKVNKKNTSKSKTKKSSQQKTKFKKASAVSKVANSSTSLVKKDNSENELDKVIAQLPADQKAKLENIKNIVENFQNKVVHRLEGYVMGISLLPPSKDEKGNEDKESINVLVLIDDKDSNKMPKEELHEKVQKVSDELAKSIDKNLKPKTTLLTEVWQSCYDGKNELLQLIAMSAIVYDTGMLAAIKLSEVHKSMVLKKFEKYIVSYVLAGSLTQGRATPESDVDVFVVIDDTDVKKMTRTELRDKLRAIIIQMGSEAGEMTGIRNKINIQVYILTDFWENIKDASPVIFTFLRDGVPFYDRGVFMPWKQLLQMGRIKPSPEAIDMYMGSGKQFLDRIEHKVKEILMEDFFWGLLTPSQAALMMYGIPPTTPKETPEVMRQILVNKEKILEDKYVKFLERVLKTRKEFEHGTRKIGSGKELDEMIVKSKDYMKRLESLFSEIQEKKQEERVIHMYESVISIIRDAIKLEGIESASENNIPKLFVEHIIKKGHIAHRYERLLGELLKAKKDYDAGKLTSQEVNEVMKVSKELTNVLIEFISRKKGQALEKTKIRVKYGKDSFGEIVLLGDNAFVISDINDDDKRKVSKAKISKFGTLIDRKEISLDEYEQALMSVNIPPKSFVKGALFDDLKNIFGPDVEILMRY